MSTFTAPAPLEPPGPSSPPSEPSPESDGSPVITALLDPPQIDCIICLGALPHDSVPEIDEFVAVARLVPCRHVMHDPCLKSWTERANTCPICRVSFNEVAVLPYVTGPVLSTYKVEDKTQRVAGDGADVSPDVPAASRRRPGTAHSLLHDRVRSETVRQLEWELAWQHLDADLQYQWYSFDDDGDDNDGEEEAGHELTRRRLRLNQRMDRRRAVAAAQAGPGRSAFETQHKAWAIPTTRPRAVFPHLEPSMSKEESDSWKMMELAEKMEQRRAAKRPRSPAGDSTDSEAALLAQMGVDLPAEPPRDERKYKRPRTKRDSQLAARPVANDGSPAPAAPQLPNAAAAGPASPPGLFTSILQGIGKAREVPIVGADDIDFDIRGRDLTRMRPLSPATTARSRSPPNSPPTSPPFFSSPAHSRPNSPDPRGRAPYSGPRTPAVSPERPLLPERRKPWDSPLASPPLSPPDSGSVLGVTAQEKADVVELVTGALKQYYPARLSKTAYTDINKRVSRHMYKAIVDGAVPANDKERWREAIRDLVERETARVLPQPTTAGAVVVDGQPGIAGCAPGAGAVAVAAPAAPAATAGGQEKT